VRHNIFELKAMQNPTGFPFRPIEVVTFLPPISGNDEFCAENLATSYAYKHGIFANQP
jgi:hypothetical protein